MSTRNVDRRHISRLLAQYYPDIPKDCSSDDWHGFLNAKTGLDLPRDMPNGQAFDLWRQALAKDHGLPVWGITEARKGEIAAMGTKLKEIVDADEAARPALLEALRREAPGPVKTGLIQ